jgi:hypothetical protein
LLLTGLIFGTVSKASAVALVLMAPALWLTSTVLGSVIANSDKGGVNFVFLALAGSVVNIALYGMIPLLFSKFASRLVRWDVGRKYAIHRNFS